MGKPDIITSCSTCFKMLKEAHPEMKVSSLWTILAEKGWPKEAKAHLKGPLAIHDPCTARHEKDVQQAVRRLAADLGAEVRELTGAEKTTCCGYGGLQQFANAEVANLTVDRRINEDPADYLAYCAMCRDNFARRGKRAVHLLDLAFPRGDDPAARPDPGFSLRRDNRARSRTHLLETLWGETMPEPIPDFQLAIAEDVRLDMERKLILVEDVRLVVAGAISSGRKLKDPATGDFIASARLGTFTCWATWQETADGPVLKRAWAHRMAVETKQ